MKKYLIVFVFLFLICFSPIKISASNFKVENTTIIMTDAGLPDVGFGENGSTCTELIGENLSKVLKASITILRIFGAIAAIVNGMLLLIPAVIGKDADALKKAGNKCVTLAIVLVLIGIFPSILSIIGNIFGYDISCIL